MNLKPYKTSIHRATTLSEFVFKLKESKTEYHLSWDIIERPQPYSATTKRCDLYIEEKYFILKTKPSLNKRREILLSCLHTKNFCYKTPWLQKEKQQYKVGTTQPNITQSYPKRTEDKRHPYISIHTYFRQDF